MNPSSPRPAKSFAKRFAACKVFQISGKNSASKSNSLAIYAVPDRNPGLAPGFGCFRLGGMPHEPCDFILRDGTLYDGSGEAPVLGDLAIRGELIAGIGEVEGTAKVEIDASGLAIAPGFVNPMCWANESLIADGDSQSDIRQGITLEVMGEGWSMGPLTDELKRYQRNRQGSIRYDIEWTTLDEYLEWLAGRGVSPNIASFVGAGLIRAHVLGFDDRRASPDELKSMRDLVRQAMAEGALGVSAALIYMPGLFADTEELIALASAAAEYDGIYMTHLRSEGITFLEALEEFFTIIRESGARGEIYHLKAAGPDNWHKMTEAIKRIEAERAKGLPVTADMYPYAASATGLDAIMPPWALDGGHDAWVRRLKDPDVRRRLIRELSRTGEDGTDLNIEPRSPGNVLLVDFKTDALKPLTGKTLAEVANLRGTGPLETAFDLIVEDNSRVGTIYFTMSEDNVRGQIALPWVSFCTDSASVAPEGVFLESNPHPRAYGSFPRVLAKYVRDEKVISLEEAVRRMAALPCQVLRIRNRGQLRAGWFADVVAFDPVRIRDHATFVDPHQYATGIRHVFVNGRPVLRDGEHTGAKPGRVIRGPGAVKV